MATYLRAIVLMMVTIGVGISGTIYYRVGVDHLFPLATGEHSGPFSSTINVMEWIVPLTLAILWLGTAAWVVAGGVQEERARGVRRGR